MFGRVATDEGEAKHEPTYFVGPHYIKSNTSQQSKGIWKSSSPQLQVNYMVNENHSFGAFYKFDRHPSSDYNDIILTDNYENSQFTSHSESRVWQDETVSKHIFNACYNRKIAQLHIDLNVDRLFIDTKTPGSTTQTTNHAIGRSARRSFQSSTNSGNNFWATKLILSYPVWKRKLSLKSSAAFL